MRPGWAFVRARLGNRSVRSGEFVGPFRKDFVPRRTQ